MIDKILKIISIIGVIIAIVCAIPMFIVSIPFIFIIFLGQCTYNKIKNN